MKVTRSAAIALLIALGFKTAEKRNNAGLAEKLQAVGDHYDADSFSGDKEQKELLEKILKASTIEVIDDEGAKEETEEKSKKHKKAEKVEAAEEAETESDEAEEASEEESGEEKPKSKKKEKEVKKEKKAAKPEKSEKAKKKPPVNDTPKDKFGNREGSQAALINAAISKKWTAAEEIVKSSGFSLARVQSHIRYLVGKELIEVGDKGVRAV